ncbi:hypothetical protein CYY_007379 [Polysphondylium violaceum]|uniref:Uncharacterized protein n=1 Tax=Polysphondylium violaceum TaxID=133409 RepID=A0A8J4PPR1_9MYCE|nr:hypothetical protein CYY_007379 [Polysphondylium violaceum]
MDLITVNSLTDENITIIIDYLLTTKIYGSNTTFLEHSERGMVCNLVPHSNGFHHICLNRFASLIGGVMMGKQCIEALYWRFRYKGQKLEPGFTLSHLDVDKRIIECVQESITNKEFRKYCHHFHWYRQINNEDTIRCPHKEHPCTGPPIDLESSYDQVVHVQTFASSAI